MVEKLTKNPENRSTGMEVMGPRNTAPWNTQGQVNKGQVMLCDVRVRFEVLFGM